METLPKDEIKPIRRDKAGYRFICTGENAASELAYNSEEMHEKYLKDPVFHRLTDWMVEHMMGKTFTHKELVDATDMASRIVRHMIAIDHGCLLNLLKDATITEEKYLELTGQAWQVFNDEKKKAYGKLKETIENLPEVKEE